MLTLHAVLNARTSRIRAPLYVGGALRTPGLRPASVDDLNNLPGAARRRWCSWHDLDYCRCSYAAWANLIAQAQSLNGTVTSACWKLLTVNGAIKANSDDYYAIPGLFHSAA